MNKEGLEIEKLRLEVQKAPFELQKLQAEVENIRLKMDGDRAAQRSEGWKLYPAYITVIVTILGGTISWFYQRHQSLEQQHREQQFKVSKELIELVKQLDSSSSALQRSAAVQLRFFGAPAASILVENLGIDRKPEVIDAILNSLERIARDEKDPAKLADLRVLVADSVARFLERESAQARPDAGRLIAHLKALEIAGDLASVPQDSIGRIKTALATAKGRVAANRYLDDDKSALLKSIDERLKGLPA